MSDQTGRSDGANDARLGSLDTPQLSKLPSANSSTTHVHSNSETKTNGSLNDAHLPPLHNAPGHGESALPADKEGEAIENIEDDWECDPENARNWPSSRKWTAVSIVCAIL